MLARQRSQRELALAILVLAFLAVCATVVVNRGVAAAAPAASWSSGWVTIAPGTTITLTHNLGGDPDTYGADLIFMDTNPRGLGVNFRYYGGMKVGGGMQGAWMQHLTASTIQVERGASDTVADKVLVRLWLLDPLPDYVSPWTAIAQGQTITLTHSVGEPFDDVVVGIAFRGAQAGVNHRAYGGLALADGRQLGASWLRLTDSTIRVRRQAHDPFAEQVRVLVSHAEPASYDSGWVSVAPGAVLTLTHNLGGDPGSYRVRLGAKDLDDGLGINQVGAGGLLVDHALQGYNWEALTSNTIRIYRQPADTFADELRVRIWALGAGRKVFLPIALRNHAPANQPSELAYDDGVAESWQSQDSGSGFAVRFTNPGAAARLSGARFYLNAASAGVPIQVHVWDAAHNDLITPFSATPPAGEGWFQVDLSAHSLTVTGDFYIGFLSTAAYQPDIGVDTSAPDGRSHEVPWEAASNDYMIRATIAP